MHSETANTTLIDIEGIKQIIPHAFPLLLVDRVTKIDLNHSIEAYKNITANEFIFQGHFPARSVYPGVYTLEGLAQVSTILAFKSLGLDNNSLVYFAGIDNVKFKKPVVPGDKLIYQCEIVKMRSKLVILDAKAFVDKEIVATALIKASLAS